MLDELIQQANDLEQQMDTLYDKQLALVPKLAEELAKLERKEMLEKYYSMEPGTVKFNLFRELEKLGKFELKNDN